MNDDIPSFRRVLEPGINERTASSFPPASTALVFALSCVLLFLGMSDMPAPFDEGITLTGAMRVAAGQMPHKDFYVNYGPAQFYTLAWLYKLFGESALIGRIFEAIIAALIVTVVFAISACYCSKRMTQWTTLTIGLLLFGITAVSASAIYPVSLLNLLASVLLIRGFTGRLSVRRSMAAGAVAGLSGMFRYDTGAGLLGVQICILAFAIYLQTRGFSAWMRKFAVAATALVAGFAVIVAPAILYYKSKAPFQYFNADIIEYSSKYYNRARGLPFPGIRWKYLYNFDVYIPLIVALLAIVFSVLRSLQIRRETDSQVNSVQNDRSSNGFLFVFGLLSFVMYFKGVVRPGVPGMYLSIVPALLALAMLYDLKSSFRPPVAVLIRCLLVLSVFSALFEAGAQAYRFQRQHNAMAIAMLDRARGRLTPEQEAWCKSDNPLTKGLCFIPDNDRIKTIDFIESHTTPAQTLYVGIPHHDRIVANDNIIYFATQRLPATHWHDLDPLLENRRDIQLLMIQDIDSNKPPYIVIDAEFEDVHEPNESDKSTGVTLLDDYIHAKYRQTISFGLFSIWQRVEA
jgi:hypothetical protein